MGRKLQEHKLPVDGDDRSDGRASLIIAGKDCLYDVKSIAKSGKRYNIYHTHNDLDEHRIFTHNKQCVSHGR
jgi:hypothetical protein